MEIITVVQLPAALNTGVCVCVCVKLCVTHLHTTAGLKQHILEGSLHARTISRGFNESVATPTEEVCSETTGKGCGFDTPPSVINTVCTSEERGGGQMGRDWRYEEVGGATVMTKRQQRKTQSLSHSSCL